MLEGLGSYTDDSIAPPGNYPLIVFAEYSYMPWMK